MYTITLSDGSKLENLRLNGNNFIANYQLSEADFNHKLSSVDIESDDPNVDELTIGIDLGHYDNMQLITLQHGMSYMEPDEYWFALAPISEEQMRYGQLRADIEYLAMMTDTEL